VPICRDFSLRWLGKGYHKLLISCQICRKRVRRGRGNLKVSPARAPAVRAHCPCQGPTDSAILTISSAERSPETVVTYTPFLTQRCGHWSGSTTMCAD